MKSVSFRNVTLQPGFLKTLEALNSQVTINAVYDRFYETGRVNAFACKWTPDATDIPKPHVFWDSDVAKWMEGASYILQKEDRPELVEKIESVIDDIEANQWEDGYINSHFTVVRPNERFMHRGDHELYCCGHLVEAAVAYYYATGRDRFLKIMCKYVDLVDRVFRVERSAAFATPGHEEIELALFKLYDCTKNEKYRDLACFFINERGGANKDRDFVPDPARDYFQDFPVREQPKANGHAVRAGYLYAAAAEMARLTGETALTDICRALFDDITTQKMYITGGIGSTCQGEAFTVGYDLPSDSAYAETCAAISLLFFAHRMLQLECNAKYADVIERTLYNGIISGLSQDGTSFFYENPLEINIGDYTRHLNLNKHDRLPITQRVKVFDCSCCPPNLNRLLSSLGDYVFGDDGEGTVAVHQFTAAAYEKDGVCVSLTTDYPASGSVRIAVAGVKKLMVRVPGWCKKVTFTAPYTMQNGYAVFDNPPAELGMDMDMPIQAVFADPRVRAASGRTALMHGPVVYCLEAQDNGGVPHDRKYLTLPLNAKTTTGTFGLPDIEAQGSEAQPSKELYGIVPPERKTATLHYIPYYAFANRGSDDMAVWVHAQWKS